MTEEKSEEKPDSIVSMPRNNYLGVLILGGVIGLLIWALETILRRYVFDVYFCQDHMGVMCTGAKNYAVIAASVIGAIVALIGLIQLKVYRPLLVLIASFLGLWGIGQLSWDIDWYVGALMMVLLYALAFGLFSWIARIREFWITILIIIVLVVSVRLTLVV